VKDPINAKYGLVSLQAMVASIRAFTLAGDRWDDM